MSIYDRDWYWQDRARKERQYYNPREFRSGGAAAQDAVLPRRDSALLTHIGIAAALVLVWLLVELVTQWRADVAAREMMRLNHEAAQRAQAQSIQMQQEAAERQARRDADLQRQQTLRRQVIAERQRLENDYKRAALTAVDRKERAWIRFYRKPAVCNEAEPSKPYRAADASPNSSTTEILKCDGRTYCSQMISCKEAIFSSRTVLAQRWTVTTTAFLAKANSATRDHMPFTP